MAPTFADDSVGMGDRRAGKEAPAEQPRETRSGMDGVQRKEPVLEEKRFDYVTRQVGQQTTRRTMVTTALGGLLALVGLAGFGQPSAARNTRNTRTGYEDDSCATSDDCLQGLRCEGARRGIDPGFPTAIGIPAITGKPGRCRYKKRCGGERGDACKRNDDCCKGENLTCNNNRCKRD